MIRQMLETAAQPKTLLLAIKAPYNTTVDIDSYFDEFENLVTSNKVDYEEMLTLTLRDIDAAMFVSKGKLEDIKKECEKLNIERVIISEPLTVQQERNLTDFFDCEIIDRTRLILEIFEKAAVSAEGKLQVAIAMFQHKKARLAGRGVWLSQQAGRIGTRGPGETAKEVAARHLEEYIRRAKRQLAELQKTRETQRKQRLTRGIPQLCLIGYTNAGKSSVLNALTKANVLAEDKLFATLDTTTRELYIDSKKKGVISDTVGFIQNLPHQLVEAFKSTLSELQYADLLLHVVDISDTGWESHIDVVHELLDELGIDKPMLYVFNKADKITITPNLRYTIDSYKPHVVISTLTKKGIQPLVDYLKTWGPERD